MYYFILDFFNQIFGNNSPSVQGGLQIAGLFVSATIAAISGIVTGFIVNSMICEKNEIYFVD